MKSSIAITLSLFDSSAFGSGFAFAGRPTFGGLHQRQTKRLAVFQKRRNRHIVQFPVLVNETSLANRINPFGKDTRSGHDSRILGTQRLRITQRPLQRVRHGLMRKTTLGNTLS